MGLRNTPPSSEKRKFEIPATGTPDYAVIMLATILALKDLGGLAPISDITKQVIKNENVSKTEQSYPQTGDTRRTKLEFALVIARSYLVYAGALENPKRGFWKLTEKGHQFRSLDELEVPLKEYNIKRANKANKKAKLKKANQQDDSASKDVKPPVEVNVPDDTTSPEDDWKTTLLETVGNISPAAFERLCKRLLSEAEFFDVEVRGKSGDNGIDGIGFLRVNLVSFKVLFQCKRQKATVAPKSIRDFRGGALGNDAKGLFITTSSFSKSARKEAIRDNTIAIDLIDGDMLCDLLKDYKLGVETSSDGQISITPEWFDRFNIEPPKNQKPKPQKTNNKETQK